MMNSYLLWAGILAIILGIIHSILGEVLVFCRFRENGGFSSVPAEPLPLRSIRIIRASWHVVTVFGFGFGVILLQMAQSSPDVSIEYLKIIIAASTLVAGVIVLLCTRGKHPGWIVLVIISMLTLAG